MTTNAKLGVAARLLVLTTIVLLPVAGCSGAGTADLNIVHYSLPGCSHCTQMSTDLRRLEDEFPGTVRTSVVDASRPARRGALQDGGSPGRGRRGPGCDPAADRNAAGQPVGRPVGRRVV
jgi:hypothetical protein